MKMSRVKYAAVLLLGAALGVLAVQGMHSSNRSTFTTSDL